LADERDLVVERRRIATPEDAEAAGFRGSPTILVEGHDPFATGDEPTGLVCRIHQTPDGPAGSLTLAQLRSVLAWRF
jgi:hypothetical protein